MLQFRRIDRPLDPSPPGDSPAAAAEAAIRALRDARTQRAAASGGLVRGLEALDRRLRTSTLERLDREDVSAERKLAIVKALHTLNARLFSYHRFLGAIAPLVRRVNQEEGRPARVVELAAGYGELTLRAPALARAKGLELEITGTDIVPEYLERGRAEARRRGVAASFEHLDAFRMDVEPGRFDIAVIAQSMHHFSAGGLATMISESRRVIRHGFVGVDGHRSLLLLWAVPFYALTLGAGARVDFAHDAFISGRRFWTESELELLARVGAPDAEVSVRTSHPGYSVLTVDFAGGRVGRSGATGSARTERSRP